MSDFLTIILVRYDSERLPGKVVVDVGGQPLLSWLIQRLSHTRTGLPGKLVVATTDQAEDDIIETVCNKERVECYRHPGDPNDVVSRIDAVVQANPRAKYIFKALGDCPFIATELVKRSYHVLKKTNSEMFLWLMEASYFPVYGAREFAMSRSAWLKIARGATGHIREHPDMFFNFNRSQFTTVYHDAPPRDYFRVPRAMRLEVDWPKDVEMLMQIYKRGPGLLAPLRDVIKWLDKNEDVARINSGLVEKTGPVVSYNHTVQTEWFHLMKSAPIYTWNNEVREPLIENRSSKINCQNCGELLGWGWRGVFYHREDKNLIINDGFIPCPSCGVGVAWQAKKESSRNR